MLCGKEYIKLLYYASRHLPPLNTLSNESAWNTQGSETLQYKTNKLSKTEQLLTVSETKKEETKRTGYSQNTDHQRYLTTHFYNIAMNLLI